jgi:ComF family protein
VWLDPAARHAVHLLKYSGLPRVAADLAAALAPVAIPGCTGALLVPVPLAPGRLRARGYNQSERLARALGRRWGRPVAELLLRARETTTQTALTPAARLANVAGAFTVARGQATLPSQTVVLVDDVFTTGATLAEAGRALEDAGASDIAAVTFGRAVIPDFT